MTGRGDILQWNAESVQASFFTGRPHELSASAMFKKAFNEEPGATNESMHPQVGRVGAASSIPQNGFTYTIQLQPGRCDVSVTPMADAVTMGSYPPKISDVVAEITKVCTALENASVGVSQVGRSAVICRLVKNFERIEEANHEIGKVLPVKFDLETERDFAIQMNRRGTQDGFAINRLVKWSVEPVQFFGSANGDPTQATMFREFWSSVILMDFNTVVPRSIFKDEEVIPSLRACRDALINARRDNLRLA